MNSSSESSPRAQNLTVVIITRNEEERIVPCLRSVRFAGQVIVADTGSTDDTKRLAEGQGARVIDLPFEGFGKTKQRAIEQANTPWVLSLDADERITTELQRQILTIIGKESAQPGYSIPRLTYFLGRPIRHGGWYPNRQLRLFWREKGRFSQDDVHEYVEIDGAVGELTAPMEHHTDDTFAHYLAKLDRYTTLAARQLAASKRRLGGGMSALGHGIAMFLRMYVVASGWRDGLHGALLAVSSGYSAFLKYLKASMIRRGYAAAFDSHLTEVRQDAPAPPVDPD